MRSARSVCLVVLVLLALAAPIAITVQHGREEPQPHDVVLAITGPSVVAQAIAQRVEALPGHPFDARVVAEGEAVVDLVADGSAEAGLTIDFRRDADVLAVSTTTDPALVDEYVVRLTAIGASYGRDGTLERVPPSAGDVPRALPYLLVLGWLLAGVALAVGLSLWRGPVASTAARGVVRLGGLAVAGLVVAVLSVVLVPGVSHGAVLPLALIGAVVVAVPSWLVLALESVLGLGGLALATAVLAGLAAPLATLTEPSAVPAPWGDVLPWTPHGAALRLARGEAWFGSAGDARSWAVLAAWAAIAVVTLVAARRARP